MLRLRPLLISVVFSLACNCSPPPKPFCGNGIKEGTEQCDDGNSTPGDGCENDCTPTGMAVCGNHLKEGAEQCDDGNQTPGDGCENDCTLTPMGTCGNHVKEGTEQCDDGNQTPMDGCEPNCTVTVGPWCGNNVKEGDEVCDDGNKVNGDGCENDCTRTLMQPVCGNHMKEGDEQCDDGNMVPGDGCENDCTLTTGSMTACPNAPAPDDAGTCAVTPGDGYKLFTGVVLVPGDVLAGGQVLVDPSGVITCAACDCSIADGGTTATRITCPSAVISPGLINSHEHISYQASPYVASAANADERYEHRHDWRVGGAAHDNHTKISTGGTATNDMIRWAELRHLMGGTTAMVGATYSSTGNQGLIRNLDTSAAGQLGLNGGTLDSQTFPLHDSPGGELTSGCAYPSIDQPSVIPANSAYLPHVAEGIGQAAINELYCVSSTANGGHDLLGPRTGIVHGVALKAAEIGLLASRGTSLIWSPRSNVSLYGDTASVPLYARLGVNVALGTDWLRSGSMNLLRELKCADTLNRSYWNSALSDEGLWRMTTSASADATQTADKIGRILPGRFADLAIYRQRPGHPHRSVIDAEPSDVVLTMRAGKALYGDAQLVMALNANCETLDVCGSTKGLCISDELGGTTYAQLAALNPAPKSYPLFSCTSPLNEPSCVPVRDARNVKNGSSVYTGISMSDTDGDGIPDATDNCPLVFNAVRPVDNGRQADGDGDGVGDACDVCPLNANTTMCTPFDANDLDSDGVPNAMDNCPSDPNPLQQDTDNDQKGDVCDTCPAPNPGPLACPTTIEDVKVPGSPYVGQHVSLGNVLVTAVGTTGFFVQDFPSLDGGPDWSGLFIYNPGSGLNVGDRITVTDGVASNYFGQIQMSLPLLGVDGGNGLISSGNMLPAPVDVMTADIATDGGRAMALEGVLVRVTNPMVTDVAPPLGSGDKAPSNEYVVDGRLRVDDLLYLTTPFPSVGQNIASITGPLMLKSNDTKLEPRSAADVVLGPPELAALEPALSFVREGQVGVPTIPTPLRVRLSNMWTQDTMVTVMSSAPGNVSVAGVVNVPAGQLSAPVLVSGVLGTDGGTVTLTAQLNAVMQSAQVRVVGAGEVPSLVSLTPQMSFVPQGGPAQLTCSLDFPAPAATAVTLWVDPDAGFATVPAAVNIPQDQLSASFTVTLASNAVDSGTVFATLDGGTVLQALLTAVAPSTDHVVISEIGPSGPGGAGDEFIELYNPTSQSQDLSFCKLQYKSAAGAAYLSAPLFVFPTDTFVAPHGYLLVAGTGYTGPAPDFNTGKALSMAGTDGHVRLGNPSISTGKVDANAIDTLGYGAAADSPEGLLDGGHTPVITTNGTQSFERKANASSTAASMAVGGSDELAGNGQDTDRNGQDFVIRAVRQPQASDAGAEP